MKIEVEVREVYGCPKIYPVCATAKIFAHLIDKKTFSLAALDDMKKLGAEISFVSCPSIYAHIPKAYEEQA